MHCEYTDIATQDLTEQQRRAIADAVFACYRQAERFFNRSFPTPTITYRRSGRNAGTAFLQQNRINFHPVLFKENKEAFLRDVIPHEVSHLIVWCLYGKVRPHGREWQGVMRQVFGCEPNTTHSFEVTKHTKSVQYRCLCAVHALSVRRHNNILKGAQYRCRKCNGTLVANKLAGGN